MDFQDEELNEILNIFRVESEDIIKRLNSSLLNLEKNPSDMDLIVLLFRDAHSLKGAARMIGFNNVQNLAHKMEDIFGLAKERKISLTPDIADIMYKTVDIINNIITQSIDDGKEFIDRNEVKSQLDIIEEIVNKNSNTTQTTETKNFAQENKNTKELNIEQDAVNENQVIEKKNNLNEYFNAITSSIVCGLTALIKLSDKIDNCNIQTLLENVSLLSKYFKSINEFDLETLSENIRVKLDVIEKCETELTANEVDEIQQQFDIIISQFENLCSSNNIDTIDFYGYAFEGKVYQFENMLQSDGELNIKNDSSKQVNKQIRFNIEDVIDKINSLNSSADSCEDLCRIFSEINSAYNNSEFYPLSNKIYELISFIKENNVNVDDSSLEIIGNGVRYCYACINNNKPKDNIKLLIQQLTVARQLLELSNPLQISNVQDINNENVESNVLPDKNKKDYNKLLSVDNEIKTLHVDSSQLDTMVNQIGELISAKIKTTKQLYELYNLNISLEEWQKNFVKIIRNLKNYTKKSYIFDTGNSIYTQQVLNAISEQSKKLNTIILNINQVQRLNVEDDMKMKMLIDDFDGMVKKIRVLPLATVFHMFGRMVRDIARESGKQVELTINGSETSADKKIIEEIKTPLIHILRNSIDHGIELPAERLENGKSEIGHIQINAKHVENKIIIEVIDDGRGFDVEKIKAKALEKGYITVAEANEMPAEEIMSIVFNPGFSTDDVVTDISGRGVGMDVVKAKIAQLNGTVKIISELNKGSCIRVELPVTMATVTSFLVQIANRTYAIPMNAINNVILKSNEEILKKNDSFVIIHNNKSIPIFYLSDLLELENISSDKELKTIIILELNGRTIGIIVDKLLGEQEILHKKFSPPLYKLKNISGITTLATGETCLILNASDLIKNALTSFPVISSKASSVSLKEQIKNKRVLIIDDSITTRTLESSILKSIGINVDVEDNPIKAFAKLSEEIYDLIISDLEMPDMSGLEFLSKVKNNELFADIPVVIMSSISDDNIIKKAKSLGAEEYIIKGDFNQKKFVKLVTDMLLKN